MIITSRAFIHAASSVPDVNSMLMRCYPFVNTFYVLLLKVVDMCVYLPYYKVRVDKEIETMNELSKETVKALNTAQNDRFATYEAFRWLLKAHAQFAAADVRDEIERLQTELSWNK